ncbi:FkbM family methyltransferase [Natronolimnobius sp. AArcel1]|uniref:FkbM family methyltransferase n=1 Tax=Natronolimnobius sp. AArcel1 TaxID=1679093 RepID=UPI0013EAE23F|nr:FkbM family methyltransferase [Natronolimnobius sp. AArcel1]NGM70320.1 FkbM family methyltransferase [Natronolimnobius sp. AArcel1]
MIRKLYRLYADPTGARYYLRRKGAEIALLVRRWRVFTALLLATKVVTGYDYFERYVDRKLRTRDDSAVVELEDGTLTLDLSDRGISRDLYLFRTREAHTTAIYRRELERVEHAHDGSMCILDIGANIGYFALTELATTSADTSVLAFEPDEETIQLLEENIADNGYQDRVTLECAAVGPEHTTATLEQATHSNLNQIQTDTIDRHHATVESTTTVSMWSLDSYLEANDLDPESIGVIRMDVEGYEVEIFEGMETVLAAETPLLVFLEMHPHLLADEQTTDLLEQFAAAGFEIVSVSIEGSISILGYDERQDVTYDDLNEIEHGYRLFLRR